MVWCMKALALRCLPQKRHAAEHKHLHSQYAAARALLPMARRATATYGDTKETLLMLWWSGIVVRLVPLRLRVPKCEAYTFDCDNA
eukprot:scaffold281001_cov20-Tisochrysis_lutea.AAC.1